MTARAADATSAAKAASRSLESRKKRGDRTVSEYATSVTKTVYSGFVTAQSSTAAAAAERMMIMTVRDFPGADAVAFFFISVPRTCHTGMSKTVGCSAGSPSGARKVFPR